MGFTVTTRLVKISGDPIVGAYLDFLPLTLSQSGADTATRLLISPVSNGSGEISHVFTEPGDYRVTVRSQNDSFKIRIPSTTGSATLSELKIT